MGELAGTLAIVFLIITLVSYMLILFIYRWLYTHWITQLRHSPLKYPFQKKGLKSWFLVGMIGLLGACFLALQWRPYGTIFGLAGLICLPLGSQSLLNLFRKRTHYLEYPRLISLLRGVHSLLEAGVPLPVALREMAKMIEGRTAQAIIHFMEAMNEGTPLKRCLEDFIENGLPEEAQRGFTALYLAHSEGLPVAPSLKVYVDYLESNWEGIRKIHQSRLSAFTEAIFAGAMPWFLMWVMHFWHPNLVQIFLASEWAPLCILTAFTLQILGGWGVWQLSIYC